MVRRRAAETRRSPSVVKEAAGFGREKGRHCDQSAALSRSTLSESDPAVQSG